MEGGLEESLCMSLLLGQPVSGKTLEDRLDASEARRALE